MRSSGQRTYTIEELRSAINEDRDIVEIQEIIAWVEDVNKADDNGVTILHWAACSGHTKIVEQLLAGGADVNQADNDGQTLLYYAAAAGQAKIVEM